MEYTVDEVYGLSRNIPLNYVERRDVDERLRCNLNRDKHITIFGSSKQGKTCLRKHCLNENDYILVQCSNRWSLSDLNANILKRAGYELTESTNVTYEGKAKVSASVKILDATLGGEAGGGATKNVTHRQLELDLSDVNDIIGALNEANFHQYIVLEDFHYLKSEVQKDFAIELKAFHESSKLCFIIVGVWLDENKLVIYTLWGEMAAQLAESAGRPELYDFVKEADKKGVSPGSEALKNLFDACGPCLVLMDELVAYAKRIYGVKGLPAGSFDNFISFIQEITEAARASRNSLVVASIPESDIEIGGEAGKTALETIEHGTKVFH